MTSELNIVTWNARGIKKKSNELFQFLLSYNIHVRVCLVSETWLNSNISLNHKEFYIYRNDRLLRRGGGVALIIRKHITHIQLPIVNTFLVENVGVKIKTDSGDINIYSCYFPGGRVGSDGTRKKMFASDIHKLSRSEKYVLGGDFNSRHQSWGCTRANCWGNVLCEKQNSYNFTIMHPTESTYIPSQLNRQSSTLDFFITNSYASFTSAEVLNELSSDHLPVRLTMKSRCDNSEYKFFDFTHANWHRFSQYIRRHLVLPIEGTVSSTDLIDSALEHFINTVNEAIVYSVPQILKKNVNKQLPRNIKALIRRRNYHRRNWLRYRHTLDFYEFKSLNSIISWQIEKFRNSSWNQLLSTLDKGSPPFWNLTKIIGRTSKNIPILKENNSRFSTTAEKCEILGKTFLNNHNFSANLTDPATENLVRDTIDNFNFNSRLNQVHTTYDNIDTIIKGLKSRKSPGADGINNSCLKYLPRKGIQFLTLVINSCIHLGYFPDQFKEAKVIPIKKPNKPSDTPSSYRPISLLSSISKVLEKVIKEKITDFSDENGILPPQQFGFRREHNTIHPLVRIRNIVKSNFERQESTGMVLLDIKAAFDSVWHDGLIFKLIQLNFPPYIIKIVQNFLKCRSFKVHIGSTHSSLFNINAGCPQGSCLSPVLYNIYTADIPTIGNCVMSIFADDTAILCSAKLSSDIVSDLQLALGKLFEYFTKWKIAINCEKSQAIYFSRKRKACFLPQVNINVNNVDIEWENNVKYLGVTLDTKLTYKDHISYIVNKCNILIRTLYPFINRSSTLNIENKMLIFKLIFHAVIFYAAPVWAKSANCHLKRLQILQNKLLKLIYNLPRLYSTARLHQIANVDLVVVKMNKFSVNFNAKCSHSEFIHISELASL